MSKNKPIKIVLLLSGIWLLLIYFFGCSPIKNICFRYGMAGKASYFFLLLILSMMCVYLLYKYTDIQKYLSKDMYREILRGLHIERKELIFLFLLVCVGWGIRVLGIDWGIDRIFQPDEPKLVGPAIRMAREQIPYHDSYGYPDQFISKIAAGVILMYSRIHPISLETGCSIPPYFIYRTIVAMISTVTIIISYFIGNKLHKKLGILFALMVTLYPEFVMMSKQVTGDATAHFFMALVILSSLFYVENKSSISVFCMAAFSAMATMEKWHSAVACFYIAIVIIFNCGEVKRLFVNGIQAFTGYVICLFLIAPNMLWSIREAIGGIIYMYSYDKDGVTPYAELLSIYINQVNCYAGIGFIVLLLCGIIYMCRNFTKKYIILLLGIIKLFMLCFLNRGFPRWAQEYYYLVLLVCAMGLLLLIENSKRIFQVIGYLICTLECLCFAAGSMLIVTTAVLSEQDTRLVQDKWGAENGITASNSIAGYYTAYNPGGTSAYFERYEVQELVKYMNDDSQINWESIEEKNNYLVVSSYADWNIKEQLESENIPVVKRFSSIGQDVFVQPCIDITDSRNEIVRTYAFGRQILEILKGANTGPDITIYDISTMK